MKVLEFQHLSADGKVLYEEKNVFNTLHTTGEEYILTRLFQGLLVPASYFLGLDNRSTINISDTMSTIAINGEPSVNSYERQLVASTDFSLAINEDGNNQANSPHVTFRALGGSWGPVRNIFMSNESAFDGLLISSAALFEQITVQDGEIVSMRMGMALRDCPPT